MIDDITRTRHLLERTGFTETPARVLAEVRRPAAELLSERLTSTAPIAPLAPPAWVHEPTLRFAHFKDLPEERRRAARGRLRDVQREELKELQGWWLANLVVTEAPLAARMTLFWQNHFTSEQRKVRYTELMYRQQRTLMRHATGRLDEMLLAVLRDPAMLLYLDNRVSRRKSPNENLARELLELFTLGEGRYSEEDIRELARALTGLSVNSEERYAFRKNLHDPAPKHVLGRDGVNGVNDVVELLVEHPATARHLVGKLWRHFVSPDPPPDAVDTLARRFRDGGSDIGVLLAALFEHPAFSAPGVRGTLFKSPVEFIVGTHRALGLPPSEGLTLIRAARSMQQELYEPPNVRGWPGGERWINSTTLLARRRFVHRLFRDDELDPRGVIGTLDEAALHAALLAVPPLASDSRERKRRSPTGTLRQILLDPAYHLC